jgi:DNA-binding NarL/FixJ family response regulator
VRFGLLRLSLDVESATVDTACSSYRAKGDSVARARRSWWKGLTCVKGTLDTSSAGRSPQAIICLEPSTWIWRRLRGLLDQQDSPSEFILARSQADSTEIFSLCRRLVPALLVIDEAHLPLVPIAELRDAISNLDLQILVFSARTDDSSYEQFFRAGCAGVLPGDASDDIIEKAIRSVIQGELWLPRRTLSKLTRDSGGGTSSRKLTRRETSILQLISSGLTNQQIADQLFISRETVRWHLRSLYSKLGVNDRTGAMREGMAHANGSETDSEPPSQA